jgi:hypothetical protein
MTGGKHVTAAECRDMRREAADTPASDVADARKYTVHTVRYHVFGRCAHDVDVGVPAWYEGKY